MSAAPPRTGNAERETPSSFTLYRFFAVDDSLLYIGLTVNPGRRMEKHRNTKSWWTDVARIEMEQHADLEALRAAERSAIETEKPLHNIRMNGNGNRRLVTSDEPPAQIDGLVGRFFHSWRSPREDDSKLATIRNGRVLEWQGHVVEELGDGLYLIELFSWWDGAPNGQQLARVDDMATWTFYDSARDMQVSLGCSEVIGDYQCPNPATHRTSVGNYVCWKCAEFDGEAKRLP